MWKKNFRKRKAQNVIIFLIIMLCSLLLSGATEMLTSLKEPMKEFVKECEPPDLVVYPYVEDVDGMNRQFEQLKEVKKTVIQKFYSLNEEVVFNGKPIDTFPRLTEYNDEVHAKARYLEGDKNAGLSLKENECMIPACLSLENKVEVGDKISISLASGKKEYTVKAIFTNPFNTSTAFDCDILVSKIPDGLVTRKLINVYAKDGFSGEDIDSAYRTSQDGKCFANTFTLNSRISTNYLAGDVIAGILFSLGIIMLFVSVLIIYYMIRNAMIADSKIIAIYKTMGYTFSDILKMYMKFYFVIVVVACLAGISCSVFLSDTILKSIFENMGQVVKHNILLPGSICFVSVVALVLTTIFLVINRAKKEKPISALLGVKEVSVKKKSKGKGGSRIQFSAFGIAVRAFTRNKRGAVNIIITCIVTIFSINFAVISLDLALNMRNNNDYWLGVDKSDIMINLVDDNSLSSIKNMILDDNRVSSTVNACLGKPVFLDWKKGMSSNVMKAFIYDDYENVSLPVVEGRNPETKNEIAISTKMAGELGKKTGDYLEVQLNDTVKVNLLVCGTYQTYFSLGETCRLRSDTYVSRNCDIKYDYLSIYLKDKNDIEPVVNDLKTKIGSMGKVQKRTEVFGGIMNMIVLPQEKAIPPVVALVVLIGSINIFCIVLLKNESNKKMNGIYKCIGYPTRHLVLSNVVYVLMIGIASIIVAFPLCVLNYADIMKSSLSSFGFIEYPTTINATHLIVVNCLVLLLFGVSAVLCSKPLYKVNARDLVNE